jgi:diguanylate cyclase (GGDEF)-like protein
MWSDACTMTEAADAGPLARSAQNLPASEMGDRATEPLSGRSKIPASGTPSEHPEGARGSGGGVRAAAATVATARAFFSGVLGRAVFIAVVAALPMAAVLVQLVVEVRNSAVARGAEELERYVRAEASDMEFRISTLGQLVISLAQTPRVQEPGECGPYLAQIQSRAPAFVNLFFADFSGTIVCSAIELDTVINIADREYFKAASRSSDLVLGEAVSSRRTGRPTLAIAYGAVDRGGNRPGIVGASLDLGEFFDHLAMRSGHADAVLSLWSNSGKLIARAPAIEAVGKVHDRPWLVTALGRGLRSLRGDASDVTGERRVFAAAEVHYGTESLWLHAGVAPSVIYKEIDAAFRRGLLIVGASIALVLGIAVFMGDRALRRPIATLSRAALRLAHGDAAARVGIHSGPRDLIELGADFDHMADELQERAAAQVRTNQELQARTGELEQLGREAEARSTALARNMQTQSVLSLACDLIQSAADLEDAIPLIASAGQGLFSDNPGAMFLFRASRDLLEPVCTWGGLLQAAAFQPQDCLAVRLGHPHRLEPAETSPRCRHGDGGGGGSVCIPMSAEGVVIGVLTCRLLEPDRAKNDLVVEIARMAAERFALAIANLQLRQRLRDVSVRDALTGLYNRRFANELLAREFGRANREGTTLCVMMLDIDHFKSFNDTYGHEIGDRLLESVGQLLQSSFRGSDVCCRYGGEEFLIVLPNSNLPGTIKRAEKLREDMKKIAFIYKGAMVGSVTCSIGLAGYPDPVTDPEALVAAADAALYEAKGAGRDRVLVVRVARDAEGATAPAGPAVAGG